MRVRVAIFVILMLFLSACESTEATPQAREIKPVALSDGEQLQVVATTSIVGDVVQQVGGQHIDLIVLMEPGQDPHSYEPAAADFRVMQNAHIIFINGMNFEESIMAALPSLEDMVLTVSVSDGVEVIQSGDNHFEPEESARSFIEFDPHVWQDPNNVIIWANNIADTLTLLDPAHESDYRANADAYIRELQALDTEIREQVARISEGRRKLVTYHDNMSYFAQQYGFEVVGTVLKGGGEAAEPTAGDLVALVNIIEQEQVPAIFVENTMSDRLADTLIQEVGVDVKILQLFTDSLGPEGSPADTYLGMMRVNVNTIVEALAQ